MNKELLAFSVAGLRVPADNEEGLAGPFRTVSALMKALEEPELDLLKEKYFVLKAKAEKIKAIEKATDEAIDAAQISPKIGDPKIDRDGELECSCNFLTKELQALYEMPLTGKNDHIRDVFLIGCYTCQRVSDYNNLNAENFETTRKRYTHNPACPAKDQDRGDNSNSQ